MNPICNAKGRSIAASLAALFAPLAVALMAATANMTGLRAADAANSEHAPKPKMRWEAAVDTYQNAGKTVSAIRVLKNMQNYLRSTRQVKNDRYRDISWRLAVYLRDVCDYDGAKAALTEAIAVEEQLHGAQSRGYFNLLNWQADLLVKRKLYAEAEAMGRDLLHRTEARFGPHDPITGNVIETLNLALLELKKFDEVETFLKRVVKNRTANLGPRHHSTGDSLLNLGSYYLEVGQLKDATALLHQGASTILASSPGGPLESRLVFRNLVRLQMDRNNPAMMRRVADQLFWLEGKIIQDMFPNLTDSVRLELSEKLEPARWYATIGDPTRIAIAILQTKLVTLDQLLAKLPSSAEAPDLHADLLKPENAAQGFVAFASAPLQTLQQAKSAFAPRVIRQGDAKRGESVFFPSPYDAMDKTIHPRAPLYAITPSQVCRALPVRTAVVELVRYKHYLGRYQDEARYGALLFRSSMSVGDNDADQLKWVPLGSAEPIDSEIAALSKEVSDPLAAGVVSIRLRKLYDLVWSPVAAALPSDTENVFVCPDGQTCFIPFGALLDPEKRFLGDKQLIMYLSTARDLFQLGEEKTASNRDFTVFAAPTYEHGAWVGKATESRFRDVDARALGGLQLTDLPGSRAEAEMLQTLASQQQFNPTLFLGDSATKQNVQTLHQPMIVHFATHGFFLSPAAEGPPGNPMDRSGLALAGAHVTLKAMADGGALPAADNDGLLTAREVARLPLAGTWIATLSACDTGRGEARDGEGVLGLRRGFLAAGVQNLMIALWKISDHETAAFMRDFYERALESSDPPTALALTQREWLGRLRKERGIAAAVTTAGAFVLNTSGRFPLPTAKPETSGAKDAGTPVKPKTR